VQQACRHALEEKEGGWGILMEPETLRKEMNPLPPSSKLVLEILWTEGAMTHKDIVKKTRCSPRTIRYALKKLKEKKLLIEKMNMQDMRQIIYQHRLYPLQDSRIAENQA
jgi:DNA-binding MarR family transcriptional regulator